jgi:hypothetical protein
LTPERFDKRTQAKEAYNREMSLLEKHSEIVSEEASETEHVTKFHENLRNKLGGGGGGGFGPFSASFHLDTETGKLTDQQKIDIAKNRKRALNKSAFKSHVENEVRTKWLGDDKSLGSTPRAGISLYRLSAHGMAARFVFDGTDVSHVGDQTLSFVHSMPLAKTKVDQAGKEPPDQVIEKLTKRLFDAEKELAALKKDQKTVVYTYFTVRVYKGPVAEGDQSPIIWQASRSMEKPRHITTKIPNLPKGAVPVGVWITPIDDFRKWWECFSYMDVNLNAGTDTFHADIRSGDGQPDGSMSVRVHVLYLRPLEITSDPPPAQTEKK